MDYIRNYEGMSISASVKSCIERLTMSYWSPTLLLITH